MGEEHQVQQLQWLLRICKLQRCKTDTGGERMNMHEAILSIGAVAAIIELIWWVAVSTVVYRMIKDKGDEQ